MQENRETSSNQAGSSSEHADIELLAEWLDDSWDHFLGDSPLKRKERMRKMAQKLRSNNPQLMSTVIEKLSNPDIRRQWTYIKKVINQNADGYIESSPHTPGTPQLESIRRLVRNMFSSSGEMNIESFRFSDILPLVSLAGEMDLIVKEIRTEQTEIIIEPNLSLQRQVLKHDNKPKAVQGGKDNSGKSIFKAINNAQGRKIASDMNLELPDSDYENDPFLLNRLDISLKETSPRNSKISWRLSCISDCSGYRL